jgi:hypothetical protein
MLEGTLIPPVVMTHDDECRIRKFLLKPAEGIAPRLNARIFKVPQCGVLDAFNQAAAI